jgi:hypothetical protein
LLKVVIGKDFTVEKLVVEWIEVLYK